MPQQTFRQPSNSTLDRGQSDPAAAETTPKLDFKWRKEGKFSKDLICSLSGKSTNPDGSKRKKSKEPDIAVALFKSLREITIYETNLSRVEVEDPKGFEVVLLLGATAIRDIYFASIKDTFNLAERSRSDSGVSLGKGKKASSPISAQSPHGAAPYPPPPSRQQSQPLASHQPTHLFKGQPIVGSPQPRLPHQYPQTQPQPQGREPASPPADPRTQWGIDAETARLQKIVEEETKAERRERERVEQAEAKRVKKMVEAEQKEMKRRQAVIQKETERLQKLYGTEQQQMFQQQQPQQKGKPQHSQQPQQPQRPQTIPQSYSAPVVQRPFPKPQSPPQQQSSGFWGQPHHFSPPAQSVPAAQPSRPSGPYLQSLTTQHQSLQPGGSGLLQPDDSKKVKVRRSIFGLKSHNSNSSAKLSKKKSSMF